MVKQYIDKDALIAEIDWLITELVKEGEDTMFEQGRISALEDVKVFINHTLEVREVNFELTWEDVAWIAAKVILKCKIESTLTAEDICKDVLKQFKAHKGE